MENKTFTSLTECFNFMREKSKEIIRSYKEDVMIDVETICEDFYTKSRKCSYIWSVGKCGTHLIHEDNMQHLDAVKCNYPENQYYKIKIEEV